MERYIFRIFSNNGMLVKLQVQREGTAGNRNVRLRGKDVYAGCGKVL